METKIEPVPENEIKSEAKVDAEATDVVKNKTETDAPSESTLRRLAPAIIISTSILVGSLIISASVYAKQKEMSPQIRNFYYQLPPSGPYMSNLAMPKPPFASNGPGYNPNQNPAFNQAPPNFRARQMTPPQWARPTPPPWVNQAPQGQQNQQGSQQQPELTDDQKSAMPNSNQRMMPPNYRQNTMAPPAWAQQRPLPRQMTPPPWARPTPPPWVNQAPQGQQNQQGSQQQPELTDDQKSAMANPQQPMMQPNYYPNNNPAFNQAPPSWARPTPPWMQAPNDNNR